MLIAAVLPAALLTAGCAPIVDYFGPRPDPTLIELAAQAQSQGNAEHADALWAEVARTCGFAEDGTSPGSCQVDRDAAMAEYSTKHAEPIDPLTAAVPVESRALIVSHAIDDAASAAPQLAEPDLMLTPAEIDQAKDLLAWEYETIWGLDTAKAFAAGDQEERIGSLIADHEQIAAWLRGLLADAKAEAPAQAAAYTATDLPLPTDTASSADYVTQLNARTQERWTQAATIAGRDEATAAATTEATDATAWLRWLVGTAAWARTV